MTMREAFPGARIAASDPRYATMVLGFNPRWVGAPKYIQLCGDTAQVVAAVQQALDEGLRITVRGGGHCYENFVSGNEGGVIIDLSPMNGVYGEDGSQELYCVEGGATLWNVYTELYRMYDRTIPAGSCYSVGVGGHVTGGGYGLLSRKHGLTIDYLYAVEVVCVDASGRAQAIVVSRDGDAEEQQLLWGHLGGGGGNFGIVTRFFFREPPQAPGVAYLWNLAWPWHEVDQGAFTELIENYGGFLEQNSDVGSAYSGLFSLLHLPQNAGPSSQIVLTVQYAGDQPSLLKSFHDEVAHAMPKATAQLAPVGYHHPQGLSAEVRELTWLWATQQLNGETPNQYGKYKSAYMIEPFPSSQIAAMWKHLSEPEHSNPRSLLQIDSYGCQVNAVAPAATAIPQRSSIMKLQYQAYWHEPAEEPENLAWIRGFYEDMYGASGPTPGPVMDGCYVNYPDVDLQNWQYLYYKENYQALQAVKQRWDPRNVFNHAQSVELPVSG
jgi:FAD/FMN-containing dehydrogenase